MATLLLLLFDWGQREFEQRETQRDQQFCGQLGAQRDSLQTWPRGVGSQSTFEAAASRALAEAMLKCKPEWLGLVEGRAGDRVTAVSPASSAPARAGIASEAGIAVAQVAAQDSADSLLRFLYDDKREGHMLLSFGRAAAYSLALGGLALVALQLVMWLAPHNQALEPLVEWWKGLVQHGGPGGSLGSVPGAALGAVLVPLLGAAPLALGVTLALVPRLDAEPVEIPIKMRLDGSTDKVPLHPVPKASEPMTSEVVVKVVASATSAASEAKPTPSPAPSGTGVIVGGTSTVQLICPGPAVERNMDAYVDELQEWSKRVTTGVEGVERQAEITSRTLQSIRRRLDKSDSRIDDAEFELGHRVEWGKPVSPPGLRIDSPGWKTP